MPTTLYTKLANENCPIRQAQTQRWLIDLPQDLQPVVVPPVHIEVFQDYEIQAESAHGRDAANAACFYEFSFVLTQLRSDDDEVFYEAPIYAETLTTWRLVDERWLVCRTILDRTHRSGSRTSLSISDCRPC